MFGTRIEKTFTFLLVIFTTLICVLAIPVLPYVYGNAFQLIGGIVFIPGYASQIYTTIKRRSNEGLNFWYLYLVVFGIGLMECYAIQNYDIMLYFLITNSLSLCLSGILLSLYLIFANE